MNEKMELYIKRNLALITLAMFVQNLHVSYAWDCVLRTNIY
jgi:hypothetical protein